MCLWLAIVSMEYIKKNIHMHQSDIRLFQQGGIINLTKK